MSFESLQISSVAYPDKSMMYTHLLSSLQSMMRDGDHPLSTISNATSLIHGALGALWTGFYAVLQDRLVLFPYQGPLACTEIAYGRGVCGQAWAQSKTIIVPDVDQFPGHIACSSMSKSEIVVPLIDSAGDVIALLDIDSASPYSFDTEDQKGLEALTELLVPAFVQLLRR